MSDPIRDLKGELLAAAERRQRHAALGSAGVARTSRRRWLERSHVQGRRRHLVALAAAVLVVVVGTASAFGGVRAFFLDRGFVGLAPLGATPSTPESGELEIFYKVDPSSWEPPGGWKPGAGRTLGRSLNWVYADGRLIWVRGDGFLEQRLTPEGVELMRSEILSTGEFGDEVPEPGGPPCAEGESPSDGDCQLPTPPPAPDKPLTVPFYTTIEVAGLGRLVHVDRARDLEHLEARLSDPASWLPESAWVDREVRAYVPSTYAVCYGGWPPDQPIEPSRLLTLLPPAAEDLLGAKDTTRKEGLFGSPGDFHVVVDHCSDVTNEEAHMLAQVFDDAGFEPFMPASRLGYRFETPGQNEKNAQIYFEPYLPHGEVICSVCG
jgi:hypothetical protein